MIKKYFSILIGALCCVFLCTAHADDIAEPDTETDEVVVADEDVVPVAVPITVTARLDCNGIKARITELTAQESLSDAETAELARLRIQSRKDCMVSGAGRQRINRLTSSGVAGVSGPRPQTNSGADTVKQSDGAKANQADMCARLPDAINARANESEKQTLQAAYDKYCKDATVAAPELFVQMTQIVMGAAPQETRLETDAEKAARIDANLAAGLCEDGTKPNKYGCCPGETFKDMGNLNFACCPADNGLCFPPIVVK